MQRSIWLSIAVALLGCSASHEAPAGDAAARDDAHPSDARTGDPPKEPAADAAGEMDADSDPGADNNDAEPVANYDIVRLDCDSSSFEPGWVVVPTSTDCGPRRRCGTECLYASECTSKPFGRCVGSASGRCVYGARDQLAGSTCGGDGDCTFAEGGRCVEYVVAGNWVCEYPEERFNVRETCASDAECTLKSDGRCRREITRSRCDYEQCAQSSDCGAKAACICHTGSHVCVPANCESDADCAAGHTCRPSGQVEGLTSGLYCTTDADECIETSDCSASDADLLCAYDSDAGHWACLNRIIL